MNAGHCLKTYSQPICFEGVQQLFALIKLNDLILGLEILQS